MTIALMVTGTLLLLAGLVGCILPVIPGPPLAYLSLIMASIALKWQAYSPTFLVLMGVLAVAVTVLDYVLPAAAARRTGAGRAGTWGSVAGMVAGLIFFPPFGVILGAFAGAVLGELAFGQDRENALRAGWGVFGGIMLGIGLKLGLTGVMGFYFVRELVGAL